MHCLLKGKATVSEAHIQPNHTSTHAVYAAKYTWNLTIIFVANRTRISQATLSADSAS